MRTEILNTLNELLIRAQQRDLSWPDKVFMINLLETWILTDFVQCNWRFSIFPCARTYCSIFEYLPIKVQKRSVGLWCHVGAWDFFPIFPQKINISFVGEKWVKNSILQHDITIRRTVFAPHAYLDDRKNKPMAPLRTISYTWQPSTVEFNSEKKLTIFSYQWNYFIGLEQK